MKSRLRAGGRSPTPCPPSPSRASRGPLALRASGGGKGRELGWGQYRPIDLLGPFLRFRRRRAAGDELNQPVAGGERDAVGDIAPGPVDEPARHVVFHADIADFGAVGTPDAPDDLDVLLVGLDRRNADLGLD